MNKETAQDATGDQKSLQNKKGNCLDPDADQALTKLKENQNTEGLSASSEKQTIPKHKPYLTWKTEKKKG
jgi:hypothetical protein